ncbi:MAG: response regulator [Flavisolibacter sp.]|nr:response regulator [Flavisolibacter sp.]
MKQATTNFSILYADDDSDDKFFLDETISSSGLPADMVYVSDGAEAIRYLETIQATGKLPSLIVLDMNMPRLDGKQTLSYIKEHPKFSSIPVIILSTSENKKDKDFCTQKGAASYLKKPAHMRGYHDIVKSFFSFAQSVASGI